MVVAEVLTGIALVKQSVDFIKSNINTAQDIGTFASHIDALLTGRDQANKDKHKAASDPFSVKNIAEETINAKLAEEHLDDMRQLIDARFGHGTWAGIISERAKRIQESKEAEKIERLEKIRKQKEMNELIRMGGIAMLIVVIFLCGLIAVVSG